MKKVIVFEDNATVADIITKMLEKAGFDCLVCKTNEEIESLERGITADAFLVDHDLGKGLTGKMVMERLNIPKDRAISTTSGSFNTSYCGKKWYGKRIIENTEDEEMIQDARAELLEMIDTSPE